MFTYPYDYRMPKTIAVEPAVFIQLKSKYPNLKVDHIEPPVLGKPGWGKIYILIDSLPLTPELIQYAYR